MFVRPMIGDEGMPFPAKGLLSGKYPAIQQQWVHLYMPTANATEIAKAEIGDTLTMSGVVSRIDIHHHPSGHSPATAQP